jgi:hypothetical protein
MGGFQLEKNVIRYIITEKAGQLQQPLLVWPFSMRSWVSHLMSPRHTCKMVLIIQSWCFNVCMCMCVCVCVCVHVVTWRLNELWMWKHRRKLHSSQFPAQLKGCCLTAIFLPFLMAGSNKIKGCEDVFSWDIGYFSSVFGLDYALISHGNALIPHLIL